jgi:hypothetical protein
MTRRSTIYPGEIGRSFDFLEAQKDYVRSIGQLAQVALGQSLRGASGLGCTAQSTPNMSVNVAAGFILDMQAMDATPYGANPIDSNLVYQMGEVLSQTLQLNTGGLSVGQSQWVLITAQWQQVDQIRTGDPTGGLLAYFNLDNPPQPLLGEGGNGENQPTVRIGACTIQPLYGEPAATGTQVAPLPQGTQVGLFLILLTAGQTSITQGEILTAGPSVGTGVSNTFPVAPFITGLLEQHHTGQPGQGPQLDLTVEVKNKLPLANCNASNVIGTIPCYRQGPGDPNGSVAGNQGDQWGQTDSARFWYCSQSGPASGGGQAVWLADPTAGSGSPPPPGSPVIAWTYVVPSQSPYTPPSSAMKLALDTTTGPIVVELPTAANACDFLIKNIGRTGNPATIQVMTGSGEEIDEQPNARILYAEEEEVGIASDITNVQWLTY